MTRLENILSKADDLGLIVIVQLFYGSQTERFNGDNNVIKKAMDNALDWLNKSGYNNFLIEVANECNHGDYSNTILHENEMPNTIDDLKKSYPNFYFGSSVVGNAPSSDLIGASDYILVHGNGKDPSGIKDLINEIEDDSEYKKNNKPIVFNEDNMDNNYDFSSKSNNMEAAVTRHVKLLYNV